MKKNGIIVVDRLIDDEIVMKYNNYYYVKRENYYDDQSFLYDIDRNFWEICCVWKDEKVLKIK